MKRSLALSVVIFLTMLPSSVSHARWVTEDDVDAIAEKKDRAIIVHEDGRFEETDETVYLITKDSGRTSRGIFRDSYNPRTTGYEILKAETLNDGIAIPVERDQIQDKPLASAGQGFDDTQQILIAFPQVRVGSRVHLKTRYRMKEPTAPGVFSTLLTFGDRDYDKDENIRIVSEKPLQFEKSDAESFLDIQSGREGDRYSLTIRLKRPIIRQAAVETENIGIVNPKYIPWVAISTTRDWADLARARIPQYESILSAPLPEEFAAIVRKATPMAATVDQINAVTSALASQMRYMGDWRPVNGGVVPRPLATIADTRYGDCKDFAVSTAAMLRKLGYQADVAWIFRGGNPFLWHSPLPESSEFNHAIVHAVKGGQVYWIDPTNVQSFAQGLFNDIMNRPALVLNASHPTLEFTPTGSPEESTLHATFDIDLTSPTLTSVTAAMTLHGRAAVPSTGASLSISRETLAYDLLKYITGRDSFVTWKADDFDLTSRIVQDTRFGFTYTEFPATLKTSAGSAYLFATPVHVSMLLANPVHRVSDLPLGDPMTTVHEYLLNGIAQVGDISALQCEIHSPWADAWREYSRTRTGLRMREEIRTRTELVSAEDIRSDAFASFQMQLRKCFENVAVVYRPLKTTRRLAARASR